MALTVTLLSLRLEREKETHAERIESNGEKGKAFPQNPTAHTCFADLFKRGSLKRTRFTFIAVHSAKDRAGEKEKEKADATTLRDSARSKGGNAEAWGAL